MGGLPRKYQQPLSFFEKETGITAWCLHVWWCRTWQEFLDGLFLQRCAGQGQNAFALP
jgi:hypothetical protein